MAVTAKSKARNTASRISANSRAIDSKITMTFIQWFLSRFAHGVVSAAPACGPRAGPVSTVIPRDQETRRGERTPRDGRRGGRHSTRVGYRSPQARMDSRVRERASSGWLSGAEADVLDRRPEGRAAILRSETARRGPSRGRSRPHPQPHTGRHLAPRHPHRHPLLAGGSGVDPESGIRHAVALRRMMIYAPSVSAKDRAQRTLRGGSAGALMYDGERDRYIIIRVPNAAIADD